MNLENKEPMIGSARLDVRSMTNEALRRESSLGIIISLTSSLADCLEICISKQITKLKLIHGMSDLSKWYSLLFNFRRGKTEILEPSGTLE